MVVSGDVVVCDFPGVQGVKRRPAIVVSTGIYHAHGADVILGEITTQLGKAVSPTDHALRDWRLAGLHQPSAFRSFLVTLVRTDALQIGRLSDRDWQEVQSRLRLALAVT